MIINEDYLFKRNKKNINTSVGYNVFTLMLNTIETKQNSAHIPIILIFE